MARRLEGRTCLIVGGTQGIGLATARRFLQEGARVVVAGRSAATGQEALAGLEALGPSGFIAADVRDSGSVEALFRGALEHLEGRLDVLFHVAGISGRQLG